jgi:hypothetical protein
MADALKNVRFLFIGCSFTFSRERTPGNYGRGTLVVELNAEAGEDLKHACNETS